MRSDENLIDNNEIETDPINPIEPIDPENPDEPDTPIPDNPENDTWYYKKIPNFYNRVRSSLSSSKAITDEVIDFPVNAPMAECKIKQRVPEWESLNVTQIMLFETCIIYMTCYQLCRVAYAKNITKQTTPHLSLEFSSKADNEPCKQFLALIDDLIAEILGEERTMFSGFITTPPSMPHCCCRPVHVNAVYWPI